jgi:hypothetical protein
MERGGGQGDGAANGICGRVDGTEGRARAREGARTEAEALKVGNNHNNGPGNESWAGVDPRPGTALKAERFPTLLLLRPCCASDTPDEVPLSSTTKQ